MGQLNQQDLMIQTLLMWDKVVKSQVVSEEDKKDIGLQAMELDKKRKIFFYKKRNSKQKCRAIQEVSHISTIYLNKCFQRV